MSEAKKSNLPAPALPRENFKPIRECRSLEDLFSSADFRDRITASVPRHMTNDRVLSVVLRAHMTNPLLLKATPQSFAGACLTATNTGLEPNSALAEAHLIPFKTTLKRRGEPDRQAVQIQVIFGYSGLLKLANNTGRLLSLSANVVFPDADVFDWMEGSDTFLKFKRGGRRDRKPEDQPGYAFFHARLSGGGESMEVWPWGDVLRIRNLSQAYRRAKSAYDEAVAQNRRPPLTWTEAPWVKHLEPMGRKTMIRAGTKYLPKSVELANAVRLDEVQERRDIDYSRVIDMAGNAEDPDYAGAAVHLGENPGGDEPEQEDVGDGGRDPTAAFGDRTVDRSAAQQNPTTHAKPQQSADDEHPGSTDARDPGFEHYLIDEFGEFDGPYLDPVKWAQAFIDLYGRTRDKATFLENNADALSEARLAPIADQLLAVTSETRDLPSVTTLTLAKHRDGKPNWPDYVNGYRHVLFGWRGDLPAWFEAQRGVMSGAPLANWLLLVKHSRERCEQLGVKLPEWMDKPPSPANDTADRDRRWVDEFKAYIGTLQGEAEITGHAKSEAVQTVMRRLRREKPPLFEEADQAVADRLAALGEGGDPPDAA